MTRHPLRGIAGLLAVIGWLLAFAAPSAQLRLPGLPDRLPEVPGLDAFRNLSLRDLLAGDALTTDLSDATTDLALLDRFVPETAAPLLELPRSGDGVLTLLPGAWTAAVQSFCLQPGTRGPGRGSGYAWAPLRGPRAGTVTAILDAAAEHPEIPQGDIQTLLWGILARTKIASLPDGARAAADRLLPRQERDRIDGSALDALPTEVLGRLTRGLDGPVRRAFEAQNRLRQAFADPGGATYAQLERLAVLQDVPLDRRGARTLPEQRWSYHPDGYLIRFAPASYADTTLQLYVPEAFEVERDAAGRVIVVRHDNGEAVRVEYAGDRPVSASVTDVDGARTTVPLARDSRREAAAREGLATAQRLVTASRRGARRGDDVAQIARLLAAAEGAAVPILSRAWASAVTDWARGPVMTADRGSRTDMALIAFAPPQRRSGLDGWGAEGGRFRPGNGAGVPGNGGQRLGQSARGQGGPRPAADAQRAVTVGRAAIPKFVTPSMGTGVGGFVAGAATKGVGFAIPNYLFGKILDFNFDTWGAASKALGGDPPRADFREFTRPAPAEVPLLEPGNGITADDATRWNALSTDLTRANATLRAAIVALDRHGGAVQAGDRLWADRQARALVVLKRDAGLLARRIADDLVALRPAIVSGRLTVAEVARRDAEARSPWTAAEWEAAGRAGLTAADADLVRAGQPTPDVAAEGVSALGAFDEMVAAIRRLGDTWAALPQMAAPWDGPSRSARLQRAR